jgi:hypothetical protein
MSALRQKRPFGVQNLTSALHPKAASTQKLGHVRKVPTAEVAVAAYSIKSLVSRDRKNPSEKRLKGASLWKSCFAETVDKNLSP